jgi:hypothetical protein
MGKNETLEKAFLIKLDVALLEAIEKERVVVSEKRGIFRKDGSLWPSPRTKVIRELLRDGIVARLQARGEAVPTITANAPVEDAGDALDVTSGDVVERNGGTGDVTSGDVVESPIVSSMG